LIGNVQNDRLTERISPLRIKLTFLLGNEPIFRFEWTLSAQIRKRPLRIVALGQAILLAALWDGALLPDVHDM
jgi:hypothetical protein